VGLVREGAALLSGAQPIASITKHPTKPELRQKHIDIRRSTPVAQNARNGAG